MTENRGAVQLRLPDLAGELPPDKRDALAREIRRLTVLADVADIVTQHLSLDHQLPRLIDRIAEALDAERTTLFLHDRDTGELFSRVLRGEGIAEIRIPASAGIAGAVFGANTRRDYRRRLSGPAVQSANRPAHRLSHPQCPLRAIAQPGRPGDRRDPGAEQAHRRFRTGRSRSGRGDQSPRRECVGAGPAGRAPGGGAAPGRASCCRSPRRSRPNCISTPCSPASWRRPTQLLGAERSTLFLYDHAKDELWSQIAEGNDQKEIRIPARVGIAGAVFAAARCEIVPDAYADSRFNRTIDRDYGLSHPQHGRRAYPSIGSASGSASSRCSTSAAAISLPVDIRRPRRSAPRSPIAIQNAQLFSDVLYLKNYNESILKSLSNGVMTLDKELGHRQAQRSRRADSRGDRPRKSLTGRRRRSSATATPG